MKKALLPFLLLASSTLAVVLPGQTLLSDDFSSPSIDPSKWQVVTAGVPGGSAAVSVQAGECLLQGRGHLVTNLDFDPNALGGIRISGTWRWYSSWDLFQVLTRSDGIPSGAYGSTQNGIELLVSWEWGPHFDVVARGPNIQLGTVVSSGNFQPQPGVTYAFTLTDTGSLFSATVTGPNSEHLVIQVPVLSDSTTAKRIVFHNREPVIGLPQCYLDNVLIEAVNGVAASSLAYGVGCAGSNGIPVLAPSNLPILGTTFQIDATNLPMQPSLAIGFFGLSRTSWGFMILPMSLTAQGLPGCNLLVAPPPPGIILGAMTSNGQCSWTYPVPFAPFLMGTEVYFQALIPDPAAGNPLGASVTNGVAARLGL